MSPRERLFLPQRLLESIVARAMRSRPQEIVGLLAGRFPGRAEEDFPVANVSNDLSSFLADPFQQFLREREIARRGKAIIAIYHSHPVGDASFSDIDLHFARSWACLHLVVGLVPQVEVKAYRVTQEHPPLEVPVLDC